ncbi:hypothetical protein BDZ88DRAFT_429655 [Geranomyces variabilis]|nr:hypothetical protein BDZ88DRAFT_429655 [Geranomyces variabilis]KAJ3133977.1 hypothetical protein HDU90_005325 [Geranomyces variabilis]
MAQASTPTESWRQKCLSEFPFARQEEVLAAPSLMNMETEVDMAALSSIDQYRIWTDLAVCYTVADFGRLADLHDGRTLLPNSTGANGIPSSESDWKCLYNELTLLTTSYCHLASCIPPKSDAEDICWEFGGAGGANCPLLLPPLPILDNSAVMDQDVTASLSAYLGLPESLHLYYLIHRINLNNEEDAVRFLASVRGFSDFIADEEAADPDELVIDREEKAIALRMECIAQGYTEVIHLRVPDHYHPHTQGGWVGCFCEFLLWRHGELGRRVPGFLMYRNYNP